MQAPRQLLIRASATSDNLEAAIPLQSPAASPSRRHLVLGTALQLPAAAALALTAGSSQAEETASASGAVYDDPADRFSVYVPSDWEMGEGIISNSRRTVVFYPKGVPPAEVNVSVVVTNVSVEFTKLGSFGNVSTFAGNLINSLDRSFLLKQAKKLNKPDEPIQVARLVDYAEARGQYLVEYTVQKLPEPARHLYSAVQLGSNGRYNRLYTLTAQCKDDDVSQWAATLQQMVKSFKADLQPSA